MAMASMEELDLSIWMGNPPLRSKEVDHHTSVSENEQEDYEGGRFGQMSGTGAEAGSDHTVESHSLSTTVSFTGDLQNESEHRPQLDISTQNSSLEGSDHKATDVSVQIPYTSKAADYEHLPGYYTVVEVLREISTDEYLVKLGSGEADLISRNRLRQFSNSSTALAHFHQSKMASNTRRATRKPPPQGYVEWSQIELDISDSARRHATARKIRRQSRQLSQESNSGEAGFQSSTTEEELGSDNSPNVGRRSLRLSSNRKAAHAEHNGEVELSSEDATPNSAPRGKRGRPRLSYKQGKPSRRLPARIKDRSYNDTQQGARRSDRTRHQPRRSMRERHEDEISAHSEEEAGPKIIATKEYFEKLSQNDPFRARHSERCDTCNLDGDSLQKGPLVFCQGCTGSYHKACLGNRGTREHLVTKVGEATFVLQCRHCLGIAKKRDANLPHRGFCSACRQPGPVSVPFRSRLTTREEQIRREEHGGIDPITFVDPALLNAPENIMFRCATCQRAWHMHHLPQRQHLMDGDQDTKETTDEKELADLRFDYYSHSWTCKDCIEHKSPIDTLVAWRPSDLEAYIPGSTHEMIEDSDKEYLIKWKAQSYFRTTWMPGAWLSGVAATAMRAAFARKLEHQLPKMTTEEAIPEDWLRIDIVFDVIYSSVVSNRTKEIDFARAKEVDSAYVKYKGLGYEDAIWEKPPACDEKGRWEDFKIAYDDWVIKHYVHTPSQQSLKRHLQAVRSKNFDQDLVKEIQPSLLTGGELMDYQLQGMNWVYFQWYRNQNCVLADEMGLGKTIQVIAFFALMVQDHKCWPFLVVVPNSTCPNWRREIKKWAPSLRAVTYYGSSVARKLVQDYELFPKDEDGKDRHKSGIRDKGQARDVRAHIVITSYESVVEERARQHLQKVAWAGLVVDEGQRLKNEKNLLYENLSKLKLPFKLLLTGTPLQNQARELFNLLQFLDPKISAAEMDVEYSTLTAENVSKLHDLIRPFFLRRTKAQVLTFLPPVAQIILPVTMSVVQKKLYKSILAKNPQLMKSIFSRTGTVAQKERVNLNNILIQLRKTLCHPFVYNRDIEERSTEIAVSHRNLVEASSKLQLLELMLPKLHERGHRVLLFSQFLDNLDIVEDFLDGLSLQHRRLDGSVNTLEKQKRIDEFNAPDSPYFAFLLSTRAGGIGINLATADTVIIMDPDFNPHQDIQALSRAHRIGQKNKVLVFQMMTRGSAEEKIMQIGKKKMALDHVLIRQMDQDDDADVEAESILRYGAEALFSDEDTRDIIYDDASVDKLLDRSQIESTDTGDDKSAESQFGFAKVWINDEATLEDNLQEAGSPSPAADTTVWDKILEERERIHAAEVAARAETLGRGKRKRNAVDYQVKDGAENDIKVTPVKVRNAGSDTDFQAQGDDDDAAEETSDTDEANVQPEELASLTQQPKTKARSFQRVEMPTGDPPYGKTELLSRYAPPNGILPPEHDCIACGDRHAMGWCRLKLAGVEHCGLCGIAHVGHNRTCPHLNSETQVATMLSALKESTESPEMKERARKHLRMIKGDLVQRKRKRESMELGHQAPVNGMNSPEKRQLQQVQREYQRIHQHGSYGVSNGNIPLPNAPQSRQIPDVRFQPGNPSFNPSTFKFNPYRNANSDNPRLDSGHNPPPSSPPPHHRQGNNKYSMNRDTSSLPVHGAPLFNPQYDPASMGMPRGRSSHGS